MCKTVCVDQLSITVNICTHPSKQYNCMSLLQHNATYYWALHSRSKSRTFTSDKTAVGANWMWSSVGLTTGLDLVKKTKVLLGIKFMLSTNFTDWELSGHIFLGMYDRILSEFQISLITSVVSKITLMLDAEDRVVPVCTIKAYKGSGHKTPLICNLVIRWRSVVRFVSWPLYSQRKRPLYQLNRGLGGSQSQFWRFREEKNVLPLPGNKMWIIQPIV
jgi:hypothetical protein